MTNYEEAIEEVLENFDFEKVHTHMALVGRTYFDSHGVPTISRLRETARGLLEDVVGNKCTWSSTGGFRAHNTGIPAEITLEFILTEYSTYLLK